MLRVSTFTPRILEIEGQYVLSRLKQKLKVFLKKDTEGSYWLPQIYSYDFNHMHIWKP
jgi:hypothetical protein